MTVIFRVYWESKVAREGKLEDCRMIFIAVVNKQYLHLMVSRCMLNVVS